MHVELVFPLTGTTSIAADHGYALFGAVSRLLPSIHTENGLGIHPIRGRQIGNRQLALMPWSTLTLRVADDQVPALIPFAGKALHLGSATIRVGVPRIQALVPSAALRSRLVIIKVANTDASALTEEVFKAAARKQLDDLGISTEATITIPRSGREDFPGRRTLRLKQKEIVGYEVLVEGLTAEESITLQERGIGGKRHMGCGVFVAFGEEAR